jgi:hypothetical protein
MIQKREINRNSYLIILNSKPTPFISQHDGVSHYCIPPRQIPFLSLQYIIIFFNISPLHIRKLKWV